MLINFKFKNCRSFLEDSTLSLMATTDKELNGLNTFKVDEKLLKKGDNELLKSAFIFGSNASGKTNVIKNLSYMKSIIMMSASHIVITNKIDCFAFLEEAKDREILFEVEIITNGIYYKYGFTILHGYVNREWLSKRENKREIEVFTRTQKQIDIKSEKKGVSDLISASSHALFLSIGNSFNLKISPDLNNVLNWFKDLIIVFENQYNDLSLYEIENGKYKDQALKILQLADIGIKDMRLLKGKIEGDNFEGLSPYSQIFEDGNFGKVEEIDNELYSFDIETAFNIYDIDGNVKKEKKICLFKDEGFNSEGTTRLLCYLGWILYALDKGKVIFIDEIDSKLHFLVVDYILQLFNSIHNNPNNAQLVGTAHNVMLMDNDLRRDQIYFTSKNKKGESSLVSLSDFKNVRKQDLFSKKYLAGFYVDLPDMRH